MKFLQKHDIIHRDFKPHNLVISDEGNLKIIDFDIAKVTQIH